MQEELEEISKTNDHAVPPLAKKSAPDVAFDSTNNTKKHQIHPTDNSKTVMVSSSLSPAKESALVELLREYWKIFAWEP